MLSASEGSVEVMEVLLKSRVNINTVDRQGNTALHHAVEGASLPCVQLLMAKNCLTDIGNCKFRSPLMLAAANGHLDIFKYMLDNGVPLRIKMSLNSESEFTLACAGGHLEIAKMILDRIESAVDKQTNLQVALLQCITRSQKEVIEFLINQGADVNYQDEKLTPPLMEAIAAEKYSIIHYLLQEGADVNIKDKFGHSPIDAAQLTKDSFIINLINSVDDLTLPNDSNLFPQFC
ncbi:hypothetical protein Aperf_G00000115969 [Anoplocephala perfoliata]